MSFEQGPYIQTALFCDKVLQEKDGVLSVIRIIDRLTITASGTAAPDSLPSLEYPLNALITLKSGEARGRHELKIVRELPSGLREDSTAPKFTTHFEGEGDRGNNIILPMRMRFEMEGLYWFYVYLDDVLMTKMPFRVIYARVAAQSSP